MTAAVFLGFVATMTAVVVAVIAGYLDRRAAFRVLAVTGRVVPLCRADELFRSVQKHGDAAARDRIPACSHPSVSFLFYRVYGAVCRGVADRVGSSALDHSGH